MGPTTVNVLHSTHVTCLGSLPGFFRIWIYNPFTLTYIFTDKCGKCHFNQPMSFLDIGFQCFYYLPIVVHTLPHQVSQLVINHKLSGPQAFVHTSPLPAHPSPYTLADCNPSKSTRVNSNAFFLGNQPWCQPNNPGSEQMVQFQPRSWNESIAHLNPFSSNFVLHFCRDQAVSS